MSEHPAISDGMPEVPMTEGAELIYLRAEVERLRAGWDADVDWANKLLRERDEAWAEVERLRVFEAAFAKVPQEQQARIMAAVRAEMGKRHLPT